ncbi:MAG: hypothetical protein KGI05_08510 [Thaumarchaeota archaeon]|nr:hypothetical protein [Nitrososphaerota archaeon]MDE1828629.1 hypothetical protein [Candidatus Micrarchaeota archaeon]
MISKLNTFLHNDKHHDIYEVKQKVNEVIDAVNKLESIMITILERAKRVTPEVTPEDTSFEPLTNFGFRPEIYCTCGKNVTACCPIHINVAQI